MTKPKTTFPKMGTKPVPSRKKGTKILTQKERYAKKKKAMEEWRKWFS